MAPRRLSRYSFAYATRDLQSAADERQFLYGDQPFRYVVRSDNIEHVVALGDTLFTLAARYFKEQPRPAGLWGVIADFQSDPIHDPTRRLAVGRVLIIPSERTLVEEIFSERRRREA